MTGLLSTYKIVIEAAELALKGREFPAAITLFQNAVRMSGGDLDLAQAKRGLGDAYRMTGDLDLAQAELEEAHQLVSSVEGLTNVKGASLRLLALVALDRAHLIPTTKESEAEREEALDAADGLTFESYRMITSDANEMTIAECEATRSIRGAIVCELGDKDRGLKFLREAALEMGKQDNLAYLLVVNLRLMQYSPTDRWSAFWRIRRLISQDAPTRESAHQVYRKLALRALVGLKVKL